MSYSYTLRYYNCIRSYTNNKDMLEPIMLLLESHCLFVTEFWKADHFVTFDIYISVYLRHSRGY